MRLFRTTRTSSGEGGRHRLVDLTIAAGILLTIVVSIGSPLWGETIFLSSDIPLVREPWRTAFPELGRVSVGSTADTMDAVFPHRELYFEQLRDGDIALWNPYNTGGTVLGSVANEGVNAPLNVPFALMSAEHAPAWSKFLELVVACAFTYLFLRRIGLSRAASWIAGVGFAFSGFQVVWTNWPHTHVGALIPAFFWAAEVALQRRRIDAFVPLALAVAASLLEGFPAVTMYALTALGIYVLVRAGAISGRSLRRFAAACIRPGVAVAFGVMLAAFQLVPLLGLLGQRDVERDFVGRHLSTSFLATMAVPQVFGSPDLGVFWGPPLDYIEYQSFIGIAILLLAATAFVLGRPPNVADGSFGALAGLSIGSILVVYVGGPLLWILQRTSAYQENFIGRARPVVAFLLVAMAAFGIDRIAARLPVPRPRQILGAVAGAGLLVLAIVGTGRARQLGEAAGAGTYTDRQLLWAWVAVAATVAGVAVLWFVPRLRGVALVVLAGVVCVEAVRFVLPFWSRIPPDLHYAVTPTHEFLAEHDGDERIEGSGIALYPGTNTHYRLRTATGHAFVPTTWAELLRAADPHAFASSPTFSVLHGDASTITSPILDRLSIRYFAVPFGEPVHGVRRDAPAASGTTAVDPDTWVQAASTSAGPLRGVHLRVASPWAVDERGSEILVRVTDDRGRLLAEGRRVAIGGLPPGEHVIPVPGEDIPEGTATTIEIGLRNTRSQLVAESAEDGRPAIGVVEPDPDDGLRLVFVDDGAIYERTAALPRVRWASDAEVVPDPTARVEALVMGAPADTVIVEDEVDTDPDSVGDVEVVRDTGDELDIEVQATGAGLVVVADPIQDGWRAFVDGEPAEILPADHAMGAVAVDPGTHVVELRYSPPGRRAGLVLAATTVALMAAAIAIGRRRRSVAETSPM